MLSDRGIKLAIKQGDLSIAPFDNEMIQPASIDVRLDKWFRTFNMWATDVIDPKRDEPELTMLKEAGETFILSPGQFALASTYEEVKLGEGLSGRVEGKSSLGRLGLMVHSTAGFIDPGFHGNITLELSNASPLPIVLHPGMKIGQLCFYKLDTPVDFPYGYAGSHYQGQRGPTPSRSHINFHQTDVHND